MDFEKERDAIFHEMLRSNDAGIAALRQFAARVLREEADVLSRCLDFDQLTPVTKVPGWLERRAAAIEKG